MDFGLIGTIAGSIFGSSVLSKVAEGVFTRRKTNADAAGAMVDSLLKWQGTLTARIEALEKAVAEKDTIIAELRNRVAQLEAHDDRHTDPVT